MAVAAVRKRSPGAAAEAWLARYGQSGEFPSPFCRLFDDIASFPAMDFCRRSRVDLSCHVGPGLGRQYRPRRRRERGSSNSGKAEAILVADVMLLLVVGRLLGEVMQRLRQPALMGQLLAGIVLRPSLFGWI